VLAAGQGGQGAGRGSHDRTGGMSRSGELELDYACLAPVANWASGCDERGTGLRDVPAITLDEVFANLKRATAPMARLVGELLGND
jgi:hypothetical protein